MQLRNGIPILLVLLLGVMPSARSATETEKVYQTAEAAARYAVDNPSSKKAIMALERCVWYVRDRGLRRDLIKAVGLALRLYAPSNYVSFNEKLEERWPGTGFLDFLSQPPLVEECSVCGGYGKTQMKCPKCEGTGKCKNGKCKNGTVMYRGLRGAVEKRACPVCKGSGVCPHCRGDRILDVRCKACGGTKVRLAKGPAEVEFKKCVEAVQKRAELLLKRQEAAGDQPDVADMANAYGRVILQACRAFQDLSDADSFRGIQSDLSRLKEAPLRAEAGNLLVKAYRLNDMDGVNGLKQTLQSVGVDLNCFDRLRDPSYYERCPNCHGNGTVRKDCATCKGSGKCPNAKCTDGRVSYRGMSKIEERECPTCKGKGRCPTCKGEGALRVPCPVCQKKTMVFQKARLRPELYRHLAALVKGVREAGIAGGSLPADSDLGKTVIEDSRVVNRLLADGLGEDTSAASGKVDINAIKGELDALGHGRKRAGARDIPAGLGAPQKAPLAAAEQPAKAKTPEHLMPMVVDFAHWLQNQQRRIGGPVARKVYALQQGNQVVLHLVASKMFQVQNLDFRSRLAEGLHMFWIECCISGGVADENNAQLAMLDQDGNVIASSDPRTGSLWVKP